MQEVGSYKPRHCRENEEQDAEPTDGSGFKAEDVETLQCPRHLTEEQTDGP